MKTRPVRRFALRTVVFLILASCATSPANKSPLRERLASANDGEIEEATKECLKRSGWNVDPIPGLTGGAMRIVALKPEERTEVYIHPAGMKPRITGGPDYESDKFWACLSTQLGGGAPAASGSAPPSPSSSASP